MLHFRVMCYGKCYSFYIPTDITIKRLETKTREKLWVLYGFYLHFDSIDIAGM